MTCYNPYNWNIKINDKIWTQGEIVIDDKNINGWKTKIDNAYVFVQDGEDVKEQMKRLSF